jgi:hypothetical protein
MVLVGILAVAGSGFALSKWINPLPADRLDAQEQQRLESEFTRLRAVRLVKVEKSDEDAVLDTMRLDPAVRQQLKRAIDRSGSGNESSLAWVSLWDFAAQDGDVVSLSSAGYTITVPLENKPAEFAVPVDASRQIQITGLHDGGGGITVGIKSGNSGVSMPVLAEGQSRSIPVEF